MDRQFGQATWHVKTYSLSSGRSLISCWIRTWYLNGLFESMQVNGPCSIASCRSRESSREEDKMLLQRNCLLDSNTKSWNVWSKTDVDFIKEAIKCLRMSDGSTYLPRKCQIASTPKILRLLATIRKGLSILCLSPSSNSIQTKCSWNPGDVWWWLWLVDLLQYPTLN